MNLIQLRIIARYQATRHNKPYAIVKGEGNSNEVIPLSEYKTSRNYKFLWSFDPTNKKDKV